jgi:hypothetical protein
MADNVCNKCGYELFIKTVLEDSYVYWCPHCLNLRSLDKNESLCLCEKYVELTKLQSIKYCQNFSTESLIYISLNLREMATIELLDLVNIKIPYVIWSTLILKDCLINSINGQEVYVQEELHQLFSYYEERVLAENLLVEVQENYFYLFEDNLELSELVPDTQLITIDERSYRAIPSCKWRYYMEAAKTIQLGPNLMMRKIKEDIVDKLKKRQLDIKQKEYKLKRANGKSKVKIQRELFRLKASSLKETMELLYNSFHSIYYNKDIFKFSEVKRDDGVLKFIDLIREYSKEHIKYVSQNPFKMKKYYEMSLNEFWTLCDSQLLDFDEMYAMLVSSKTDCKAFPLLVEHDSKILVCPEMLLLISAFIRFESNKEEYKSELRFLGDDFEESVVELFESHGFSLNHPKHKKQKLVRFKIESIGREFDLLPYNEKYLFVIECKRNSLKPGYIFESERKRRATGLKDEIDSKHLFRVQYFQDKYKLFGFKSDKVVKGLIVTLIKEEIEEYNGIDIVPYFDLQEYIENYID